MYLRKEKHFTRDSSSQHRKNLASSLILPFQQASTQHDHPHFTNEETEQELARGHTSKWQS